jgi:hypothetical protein
MANGNFVENLIGDVKHTARTLWRSRGFAATAIAALGSNLAQTLTIARTNVLD